MRMPTSAAAIAAAAGIAVPASAVMLVVNPIADLGLKNSVFEVGHWETPNGDAICADGGANGVGINDKGCADGSGSR